MSLKNKTLKANQQKSINTAAVKKRNIEQTTLKSELLKQHTIENFINREYIHIPAILGNSNN